MYKLDYFTGLQIESVEHLSNFEKQFIANLLYHEINYDVSSNHAKLEFYGNLAKDFEIVHADSRNTLVLFYNDVLYDEGTLNMLWDFYNYYLEELDGGDVVSDSYSLIDFIEDNNEAANDYFLEKYKCTFFIGDNYE